MGFVGFVFVPHGSEVSAVSANIPIASRTASRVSVLSRSFAPSAARGTVTDPPSLDRRSTFSLTYTNSENSGPDYLNGMGLC